MRLGTSSPLKHDTPEEWAQNQLKLGSSAVVFPVQSNESEQTIISYKEAAEKAGLTIAEVGIWKNALAADPDRSKRVYKAHRSCGQGPVCSTYGYHKYDQFSRKILSCGRIHR